MRRTLAALLAGALLAAFTLFTTPPANADVVNKLWIAYKPTSGGKRYAAAFGGYSITGLDPNRIHPTGKLSLSGFVADVGSPTDDHCTWVLFRIAYYDYEKATPKQTNKGYRSCVPRERVHFAFEHEDVYKLEAKACWVGKYDVILDRTCVDPYQEIFKTYP
ncbi:hypothetical protein Skr01_29050 [Sphaerisporangium krabiense]|uniref:Secreted protein n=1 Tax=Sphaerisporangium krabiense TaxID=763782 RepID=A0A7W8ZA44_9ACTN|nr:hypothetical protein [Sphaerisporangium krabiense]MBB5630229.1 hypothetical protein [Sphaerisporangium krabiense]GII62820.1 hypothetical protein Skr01_29050 [Sphaerisporangium krabiense]